MLSVKRLPLHSIDRKNLIHTGLLFSLYLCYIFTKYVMEKYVTLLDKIVIWGTALALVVGWFLYILLDNNITSLLFSKT